MDRTHFADDATLRYMATLEARVQLLAKALQSAADRLYKYGHDFEAECAEKVLVEAGLTDEKPNA